MQNLYQQTINKSCSFEGSSLHSGEYSRITLHPAPANTGINFKRIDLAVPNHQKVIECNINNIVNSQLCSSLENMFGYRVSMTEHLLSALHGLNIDNALIDLDSDELPILDGSSKIIVEKIESVGVKELRSPKKVIKILKSFMVGNEDSFIKVTPSDRLSIDYTIVYDHSLIKKQNFFLDDLNEIKYKEMISSSRTFGFEEDVNYLRSNGFALGGNLDNAVVVGKDKILNKEGLRYKDEFVRHKILDSIGDLYLAGYPVQGYFFGKKSGHFLNNELLKKLLSSKSNYEII